jgi:urate oxidase
VTHPERFALHLGTYFVSKYAHIHKAFITIEQLRWKRIDVNGQQHSHSFWRDGDEKRQVDVEVLRCVIDDGQADNLRLRVG